MVLYLVRDLRDDGSWRYLIGGITYGNVSETEWTDDYQRASRFLKREALRLASEHSAQAHPDGEA